MTIGKLSRRRRRGGALFFGSPNASLLGVGAGTGTQPDAIANLFLWHKADGSLFVDSARTTPVTADADAVGSWSDESGSGLHLVQTGGNNRPKYKTNIVNGEPVVRFDYDAVTPTDSDFLDYPNNSFDALTAAEIFVVKAQKADPAPTQDQSGLWSFGSAGASAHPYTDGIVYENFGSSAQHTVGNMATALTTWHLFNFITTATEFTANLNGAQAFTTGTNTVAWAASPLRIGNTSALASYMDGDIAEIVMYSAKISAGDRTGIKAYFAAKYGITIS